jgi:hypothetical protein
LKRERERERERETNREKREEKEKAWMNESEFEVWWMREWNGMQH